MNKGDLTNSNDNKAHARKDKSLVEFNANYFSNLAENSKFTFYCQKLFFLHSMIYDGMVAHQAAQLKY